jgi:SPP1 family predicted phage head-tail adaptor
VSYVRRAAPISASELDQRVVILARTTEEDARGQSTEGWRNIAAVAARARPTTSREVFKDGAVQSLGTVVFGIRYRAGLTAAGAVRWRGTVYELLGEPINIDGANHTLELIAGTKPT